MWWYQGCSLWYDPVMRAAGDGCGGDLVAQLCSNLCDLIDCSPPGFSVHGISQASILESVAIFFSRGSSWPRSQNHISCAGNQILYHWATREAFVLKFQRLLLEEREESEKVGLKLNIQKMKIMASSPHHFMANRWRNSGNSGRLYFLGLQNHCRWWLQPWN